MAASVPASSPNALREIAGFERLGHRVRGRAPAASAAPPRRRATAAHAGRASRRAPCCRMPRARAEAARSSLRCACRRRRTVRPGAGCRHAPPSPCAMPRATKARLRCPPESCPICRSARSVSSTRSSASSTALLVRRARSPQRPLPAVPAHHHDVAHRDGERPVDIFALRHVADQARGGERMPGRLRPAAPAPRWAARAR